MNEQKAEAVRQLAKLAELFELTAAAFEGVRDHWISTPLGACPRTRAARRTCVGTMTWHIPLVG
ncbi:MAG TPA: hypothetical protein VHY21_02615 [Pseudonocardiaceae bacterium]|jgi:hypothetical protein|nr:hypothetical protein [Pseudonocardiaceae bacterium]